MTIFGSIRARCSGFSRILGVTCLVLALVLTPARRAHAWGSFNWFYNILSGNDDSPLPTVTEAYTAYSAYYTSFLLNATYLPPETLWAVITGGQGVSLAQRKSICFESGGKFASTLQTSACTNGHVIVTPSTDSGFAAQTQTCNRGVGDSYSQVCMFQDHLQRYYWNDGPSIPKIGNEALPGYDNYILLFWPAGVLHDYCYHHGEATYGYSKAKCDEAFYSMAVEICVKDLEGPIIWFHTSTCVQAAQLSRLALQKLGGPSWYATSSIVDFSGLQTMDGSQPELITTAISPLR
jgi:hypothetical protein